MPERTTVISVRGRDRAALLADPRFVYVGRAVGRAGWRGSAWANPFKVREGDPDLETPSQVVMHFRSHLLVALHPMGRHVRPEFAEMARSLPELRGKVLGCWCCDWDGTGEPSTPCHAVVLARLADGIAEELPR